VSKYVETLHGSVTQEKVILGSSNGTIEVEAVNLDKIRNKFNQVDRLREVSLDGETVATGDDLGSIRQACPSMFPSDRGRLYRVLFLQIFVVLIYPRISSLTGIKWLRLL
jgi:hypothetical protein